RTDDPTRFTFACRGYALAKCAELGYKPWSRVGSVSLASYHQACTRMLRADYCGDGTPWTHDGTLISVFDGLGIGGDAASVRVEAEWNADGAVCTNPGMSRKASPPCYAQLFSGTCGARQHFQTGALVMNAHGELSP